MDLFLEYILWITPGFLILLVTYLLLPKNAFSTKIFILILGFILIRDNMTTFDFWHFGTTNNLPWMRFTEKSSLLILMGVASLMITGGIIYLQKDMRHLLFWIGNKKVLSLFMGILGAIIVVLPFFFIYQGIPLEKRGGFFPTEVLPLLFFFSLSGNLMEEVLFRGYLQGYLETITDSIRAALLSGLMFGVGHVFLATTVTTLGLPLILFTFFEGIICSFVRLKYGIFPSTLTHGLSIFVLASSIF